MVAHSPYRGDRRDLTVENDKCVCFLKIWEELEGFAFIANHSKLALRCSKR